MTSSRIWLRFGAFLAVSFVIVACSSGGDTGSSGEDNAGESTIAVTDGVAEITADDIAFNASTITSPADQPFTVSFINAENQPHNFAVYTEEGGEEIAVGDVINEGETNEVEIEGLPAGEYFFVCDVHSGEMKGTLIVEG